MEVWIFLGRSLNSDQNFIALRNGTVVRARAMVRIIQEQRWDKSMLQSVRVTPSLERPRSQDMLEDSQQPHDHVYNPDFDDNHIQKTSSRVRITQADLTKYGYRDG